jgi:hypothetical protein
VSFAEYELYGGDINYIHTVIQCISNSWNLSVVYMLLKYSLVLLFCLPLPPLHQLLIVSIAKFTEFSFPLSWKVIFRILGWIQELRCMTPSQAHIHVILFHFQLWQTRVMMGRSMHNRVSNWVTQKWFLLCSCCYLNTVFYFPGHTQPLCRLVLLWLEHKLPSKSH